MSDASSDFLFRLRGDPVCKGDLAIFLRDPERPGIVVDYVWDEDAHMHLVLFLVDGQILRLARADIRLP